MVKLGGTATASHMTAFQGIESHFKSLGIDLEWILYSDEIAVVDAFVAGEIDMAWNGPLNYVRIKQQLEDQCRVIAMRDVDFDFVTHFVTTPGSHIFTVEDLMGKKFALGNRGSVEAGLLAHYFLKQSGINPKEDLAACTFFDQRQSSTSFDQIDVVERVMSGEYDAGAISGRALSDLLEKGSIGADALRVFWTSPGYSHCCFTAQSDMEPTLYQQLQEAFESVDASDLTGKSILDAEACNSMSRGVSHGWEILEKAALEQGLI